MAILQKNLFKISFADLELLVTKLRKFKILLVCSYARTCNLGFTLYSPTECYRYWGLGPSPKVLIEFIWGADQPGTRIFQSSLDEANVQPELSTTAYVIVNQPNLSVYSQILVQVHSSVYIHSAKREIFIRFIFSMEITQMKDFF